MAGNLRAWLVYARPGGDLFSFSDPRDASFSRDNVQEGES